jgi:hypothetical protein
MTPRFIRSTDNGAIEPQSDTFECGCVRSGEFDICRIIITDASSIAIKGNEVIRRSTYSLGMISKSSRLLRATPF